MVIMLENNNLEIVRKIETDFENGQFEEAADEYMANDVTWVIAGSSDYPFAGCYQGLEKVRKVIKMFGGVAAVDEYVPAEYIAQGDKVVSLGFERGHFIASGRTYEVNWAHVFTLYEGKVIKFHEYLDP